MIGTLPNIDIMDYESQTLTNENRYYAINHRLDELRFHTAIPVSIQGEKSLTFSVDSFAFVGAISSFQIHLRLPYALTARLYNTVMAISAPLIGVSANSPYLFSKALWSESRIPFYEPILKTAHPSERSPRVFFGTGYVNRCTSELFLENALHYWPLLPQLYEDHESQLSHLRLHNGNIYRWNRPVLDIDSHNQPYFRVEHRSLPAGPTVLDKCKKEFLFCRSLWSRCHSTMAAISRTVIDSHFKNITSTCRGRFTSTRY